MIGFVSAYVPWNAISNLELRQSYRALHDDLLLPSAATLSNICCAEYALTVDAIKKQLPSQNKVSLALDGWTSTNKLAITLVIVYYMDRKWALREVQLTFDEVDHLLQIQIDNCKSTSELSPTARCSLRCYMRLVAGGAPTFKRRG